MGYSDPLKSRRERGIVLIWNVWSMTIRVPIISFTSHLRHHTLHFLSLNVLIMVEYRSSKEREEEYDRLAEVPLPCSMEELRKLYDITPPSAATTSDAELPDPASSHQLGSVVSPTMPGSFPDSKQSRQDQTAKDKSGQLSGVGGRSVLHGGSGRPQGGNGEGEKFYESEGDDDLADDDLADDCSPPWLDDNKSWHLSPDNAAAFCRQYHACLREDGTSYSRTAGTVLNATQSNQ
jgi:hypothetical protein